MADSKISALSDGGAIQAADEFVVARGGASYRISGDKISRLDGWLDDTAETWSFSTATAFTVSTDLTAKYTPGTRVQYTQSGTVKYGTVASSTFASSTTTVNLIGNSDYTIANSAITVNYHSYEANPQGYPGWFNWAPAATGFSGTPTVDAARFSVVGRTVTFQVSVSGTSNATTCTITLPIATATRYQITHVSALVKNNSGNFVTGAAGQSAAGTTLNFFLDANGTAFTASGAKAVRAVATYEM